MICFFHLFWWQVGGMDKNATQEKRAVASEIREPYYTQITLRTTKTMLAPAYG
jgi:hypothetical protein